MRIRQDLTFYTRRRGSESPTFNVSRTLQHNILWLQADYSTTSCVSWKQEKYFVDK